MGLALLTVASIEQVLNIVPNKYMWNCLPATRRFDQKLMGYSETKGCLFGGGLASILCLQLWSLIRRFWLSVLSPNVPRTYFCSILNSPLRHGRTRQRAFRPHSLHGLDLRYFLIMSVSMKRLFDVPPLLNHIMSSVAQPRSFWRADFAVPFQCRSLERLLCANTCLAMLVIMAQVL